MSIQQGEHCKFVYTVGKVQNDMGEVALKDDDMLVGLYNPFCI